MREETQNSVNLKLIVFFDPEDRTYGIWAHNLTSKEAPRGCGRAATQRASRVHHNAALSP
jgi:hypothetical protein